MIKNNIAKLLETEMERKDFLKLVLLGAVAATGITQVFKAVSQQQATPRQVASNNSYGYGSSVYGGARKL